MLPQFERGIVAHALSLLLFFAHGAAVTCWTADQGCAQSAEIQVYTGAIVDQGMFNLTLHNNYIAQAAQARKTLGGVELDRSLTGGTEWAYGTTPWLEYGLYLPIYTLTPDRKLLFDGAELRALFVTPHAEDRDVVYGMNVALGFNNRSFAAHFLSLELRPLWGMALGPMRLTINPIISTDFAGESNITFSPAARVEYPLSKRWSAALEEYSEFGSVTQFNPFARQQHKLFLVSDYKRGSWSLEVGVGAGLTSISDPLTLKLVVSCDLPRSKL